MCRFRAAWQLILKLRLGCGILSTHHVRQCANEGARMGLFFRSPKLQKNERVRWRRAANHEQSGIARGGRLFLTSRRLIFAPNRLDFRMGGQDWEAPLDLVNDIEVADRALREMMGGGMRRRLRVILSGGSEELFVINDAEKAAETLRQLLHNQSTET